MQTGARRVHPELRGGRCNITKWTDSGASFAGYRNEALLNKSYHNVKQKGEGLFPRDSMVTQTAPPHCDP